MPSGRPRTLDDAKQREYCALIGAGCLPGEAARMAGCSTSTVRREAMRNEEFAARVRRAEMKAKVGPLRALHGAAATHWRAAAWLLSRTAPKRSPRRDPAPRDEADLLDRVDHIIRSAAEAIDDPRLRQEVCDRLYDAAVEGAETWRRRRAGQWTGLGPSLEAQQRMMELEFAREDAERLRDAGASD